MAEIIQGSQYWDPFNPNNNTLQFTTDSYFMERGPRYDAYAQLRESNLRSKREKYYEDEQVSPILIPVSDLTPKKKSVRFQGSFPSSGKMQGSSVLTQSVPDLSPRLRKENRRPPENSVNRIPKAEKSATPPPATPKREKMYGSGSKFGAGGKSVNSSGEKGSSRLMVMGRKSYASIEELKGLSIAAVANSINGENRGGKRCNVLRKSTVFSTKSY